MRKQLCVVLEGQTDVLPLRPLFNWPLPMGNGQFPTELGENDVAPVPADLRG